ncbi:hypothetical protein GGR56DRAFT_654825 [Xylariaceae sp. FL0804]|nr:hypothetical protein GGR56DRAFT_654825 [Xylariaceae sp. FL0804]
MYPRPPFPRGWSRSETCLLRSRVSRDEPLQFLSDLPTFLPLSGWYIFTYYCVLKITDCPEPSPLVNSGDPPASAPMPCLHPALLRVCRQLHAEGTPFLYRTNAFLAHPSLLVVFPSLFQYVYVKEWILPLQSFPRLVDVCVCR